MVGVPLAGTLAGPLGRSSYINVGHSRPTLKSDEKKYRILEKHLYRPYLVRSEQISFSRTLSWSKNDICIFTVSSCRTSSTAAICGTGCYIETRTGIRNSESNKSGVTGRE